MKQYIFHLSGTHCESCKIFIEDTLSSCGFIAKAHADIGKGLLTVETNKERDEKVLSETLTELLKECYYIVSLEKKSSKKESKKDFWKAVLIGLVFLVLFFIVQKSGILNFGLGGKMSPLTGFLIGVVASFSSCLAVVGGLVLSLSAKVMERDKKNKKPLILFHIGRIVGFAFLGGVLGLLGDAFQINYFFTGVLGLLASSVMIFLGLNLLGVLEKNRVTLPDSFFSFFRKKSEGAFAPVLLGVATFFLPCGFTQSMQIAALSTGSFIAGSSLLFFFALGTLPVLLLLSFGSSSFSEGRHSSLFFKIAGVVVIGFGLFSFLTGLAGIGIISPLFSL